MSTERIKKDFILPRLKQGEELIGFFQARYVPFLWFFLIGPIMLLGIRIYYIAVTNQGLHIHKLSFFSMRKVDVYNFFSYAEISKINLGKALILPEAPLKLVFSNGRKLKLRALVRGGKKAVKLDDRTRSFLLSKSS